MHTWIDDKLLTLYMRISAFLGTRFGLENPRAVQFCAGAWLVLQICGQAFWIINQHDRIDIFITCIVLIMIFIVYLAMMHFSGCQLANGLILYQWRINLDYCFVFSLLLLSGWHFLTQKAAEVLNLAGVFMCLSGIYLASIPPAPPKESRHEYRAMQAQT